jgi:hypothetical protein
VYIKDYKDALEERLNTKLEAITSRLDALTNNLINPLAREEPHHAAPLRDVTPQRDGHVDVLARRPISPVHGGVAADFENDVGYAPRQPHFDALLHNRAIFPIHTSLVWGPVNDPSQSLFLPATVHTHPFAAPTSVRYPRWSTLW